MESWTQYKDAPPGQEETDMFFTAEPYYFAARLEAELRNAEATRNAILGVPAWKPRWPFARAKAQPLATIVELRPQGPAVRAGGQRHAA